jgi:hypothetical protein
VQAASTIALTSSPIALTRANALLNSRVPSSTPPTSMIGCARSLASAFNATMRGSSGNSTMPASYGLPVKTSNRSTCLLARKTASGPRAVPLRYDVVASNGTGMTWTAASCSPCGRPKMPESSGAAADGSNGTDIEISESGAPRSREARVVQRVRPSVQDASRAREGHGELGTRR